MKATRAQVERALDTPDPAIRLFLLHGPDEASSRALAARLATGLGGDAERVDLAPSVLREDPARLADEAAAIAMFGGPRHILVDGAGDEVVAAVTALLEANAAGNPAIVVAGALRKDSALVKLALAAPAALAFASYLPEGADADRMVMALGRATGLRMRGDVARRLAEESAGDRGVIAAEIAKLALYLDAVPERPAELDHDALDALAADGEGGDLARLVDAALSGAPRVLDDELARMAGTDAIRMLRMMLRRLLQLAELRARVEAGDSVDSVMAGAGKAVFYKEKAAVTGQLARLGAAQLTRFIDRVAAAERSIKHGDPAGDIATQDLMLAIGRAAARAR